MWPSTTTSGRAASPRPRQVRRSIGIYRTEEASFGGEHFSQGVNTTYRLVHGEGDNLPGLVIDCYGKTAVMQAHSVGMHVSRMAIAKALKEVMGDRLACLLQERDHPALQGQPR